MTSDLKIRIQCDFSFLKKLFVHVIKRPLAWQHKTRQCVILQRYFTHHILAMYICHIAPVKVKVVREFPISKCHTSIYHLTLLLKSDLLFSSSFFGMLSLWLLFDILYLGIFVPLMSYEPCRCGNFLSWLDFLWTISQRTHSQRNLTAVLAYTVQTISSLKSPRNLSGEISECHLLLQHHVEVVKVAVTPTDVPLLDCLAAIILLCNTDEVNCILHAMLRTRTCQTRLTGFIMAAGSHEQYTYLIQNDNYV